MTAEKRRLTWRLKGPAVDDGTAPVDYVARMLLNLQSALRHLAEDVDDTSKKRRRGPAKRRVAELATLRLVKITKGSFQATLELPPQTPAQSELWDMGEQALDQLMSALEVAADGDFQRVPSVVRPEVIEIMRIVGDGIQSVEFRGITQGRKVKFDKPLPQLATLSVDPIPGIRSGRLKEVDFKDHTAELYDAVGKMTKVRFRPDQEADLEVAANRYVTLSGVVEEGGQSRDAMTLESVDASHDEDSFWTKQGALYDGHTAEPLTREAMSPADFWPDDLDADEFIESIHIASR